MAKGSRVGLGRAGDLFTKSLSGCSFLTPLHTTAAACICVPAKLTIFLHPTQPSQGFICFAKQRESREGKVEADHEGKVDPAEIVHSFVS